MCLSVRWPQQRLHNTEKLRRVCTTQTLLGSATARLRRLCRFIWRPQQKLHKHRKPGQHVEGTSCSSRSTDIHSYLNETVTVPLTGWSNINCTLHETAIHSFRCSKILATQWLWTSFAATAQINRKAKSVPDVIMLQWQFPFLSPPLYNMFGCYSTCFLHISVSKILLWQDRIPFAADAESVALWFVCSFTYLPVQLCL